MLFKLSENSGDSSVLVEALWGRFFVPRRRRQVRTQHIVLHKSVAHFVRARTFPFCFRHTRLRLLLRVSLNISCKTKFKNNYSFTNDQARQGAAVLLSFNEIPTSSCPNARQLARVFVSRTRCKRQSSKPLVCLPQFTGPPKTYAANESFKLWCMILKVRSTVRKSACRRRWPSLAAVACRRRLPSLAVVCRRCFVGRIESPNRQQRNRRRKRRANEHRTIVERTNERRKEPFLFARQTATSRGQHNSSRKTETCKIQQTNERTKQNRNVQTANRAISLTPLITVDCLHPQTQSILRNHVVPLQDMSCPRSVGHNVYPYSGYHCKHVFPLHDIYSA